MLEPGECWRCIGAADIAPVLPVLAGLPFIQPNHQSSGKYQAQVVLRAHFPKELEDLRAAVEAIVGGHTARAILRKLAPGQHIPPHVDDWMPAEAEWTRYQLPLVTDPRIIMRWPDDGQEVHLMAGHLYEVRYDRLHEVVNNGLVDRIHMQIDQVGAAR